MDPQSFATRPDTTFDRFFGQSPLWKGQTDANANRVTNTEDYPVSQLGRNLFVAGTIQELVISSDNFWTTRAFPITVTDQISWKCNITTFNEHIPRNTPYQATSRLMTHQQTSSGGYLERRGIAFEMEHDFMDTPEGQKMYALQLNQMANAQLNIMNISCVRAAMNSGEYHKAWQAEHGMTVSTDPYAMITHETEMFAILQKQRHGLLKLDAVVGQIMDSYKGIGDMWIVSPSVKMFEDLVPPENTLYFLSGPRVTYAPENSGTPGRLLGVGGPPVYFSKVHDHSESGGTSYRNLLARDVEIGSYHTMVDIFKEQGENFFLKEYRSEMRYFRAYNESEDEWTIITLKQALDSCHAFDKRTGMPYLPINERMWCTNPADKDYDMFSYQDDNNTDVRKPVRLFGHLSDKHFSAASAVNLARTFLKFHCRDRVTPGQVEVIFNNGIKLVEKIMATEVSMSWLFNVYFEHVKTCGGLEFFKDIWLADESEFGDNAEFTSAKDMQQKFIETVTEMSLREDSPIRIFKSRGLGGLPLPRLDYARILEINGPGALLSNKKEAAEMMMMADTVGMSGGKSAGALVGYGTWDGLLMLQREMRHGSSNVSGFTRYGYSIQDCQAADDFVKLVQELTSNLSFIFVNTVFLDKNNASSLIDDPTNEHTVAEFLLGLNGIPLFLDALAVKNLNNTGKDAGSVSRTKSIFSGPGRAAVNVATSDSLYNVFEEHTITYTSNNDAALTGYVDEWVRLLENAAQDSESSLEINTLIKEVKFHFSAKYAIIPPPIIALTEEPIDNGDKLIASLTEARKLYSFLGVLFPFSDLTPVNQTYLKKEQRKAIIHLINAKISTFASSKKVTQSKKNAAVFAILRKAVDFIQDKFGLRHVYADMDRGVREDIDEAFSKGFGAKDEDKHRSPNREDRLNFPLNQASYNEVKTLQRDLLEDAFLFFNTLPELAGVIGLTPKSFGSDALGKLMEKIKANIEEASRLDGTAAKKFLLPVLAMLNVHLPADLDANEVRRLLLGEPIVIASKSKGSGGESALFEEDSDSYPTVSGQFIDDSYESNAQREQVHREGFGKSKDQLFFRSPLCISARQVLQLTALMKSDRARTFLINVRIGDPNNNIEFIDPAYNHMLADKIIMINRETHNNFSMGREGQNTGYLTAYEPSVLFFPENIKLRDRALAMSGFGITPAGVIGRMGGASSASGRPVSKITFDEDEDDLVGVSRRQRDPYTRPSSVFGARTLRDHRTFPSKSSLYDTEYGQSTRTPYLVDDDYEDDFMDGGARGSNNKRGLDALRNQLGGGNTRATSDRGEELTANTLRLIVEIGSVSNNKLLQMIAKVYFTSLFTIDTIERFREHNILIPFNVLFFRPHMTYDSHCGIKMGSDGKSGTIYMGKSSIDSQSDVSTKTFLCHFTFHHDAAVLNKKNIFVQRNMYIAGCKGHAGWDPINRGTYDTRQGRVEGSVIPVIVPYEETKFDNYMDTTGRLLLSNNSNMIDRQTFAKPCYSQCWRANQVWRFRGEGQVGANEIAGEETHGMKTNTVVIRGQQDNFSLATGDYTDRIINKGHWGPEAPGCRSCRNGGLSPLIQHPSVQIC